MTGKLVRYMAVPLSQRIAYTAGVAATVLLLYLLCWTVL